MKKVFIICFRTIGALRYNCQTKYVDAFFYFIDVLVTKLEKCVFI